jgi:hypothetical protein
MPFPSPSTALRRYEIRKGRSSPSFLAANWQTKRYQGDQKITSANKSLPGRRKAIHNLPGLPTIYQGCQKSLPGRRKATYNLPGLPTTYQGYQKSLPGRRKATHNLPGLPTTYQGYPKSLVCIDGCLDLNNNIIRGHPCIIPFPPSGRFD